MATVYKPRSAWTSRARGGAQLTGAKLDGLAFHWPGSATPEYGVETEAEVAARLRGWQDYHINGRGWSDIGYNFAIDQAGRVWDLRGLERVGAHCASPANPDANHEWIGVLLILGARETPSAAMIEAARDFRTRVFLARWPGRTAVTGHRGVPGAQTSCPGDRAWELVRSGQLNQPPGSTTPTPPAQEEEEMLGIVSRYGSSQYVLICPGPWVQVLSPNTYNNLAKTPGIKVELLTNAQINMLISLQGYRERRDRAVIWQETTVARGGEHRPIIQEVADILTLVRTLPALIQEAVPDVDISLTAEQIQTLAAEVSERVERVKIEISQPPELEQVVPGLTAEPDEADDDAAEGQ